MTSESSQWKAAPRVQGTSESTDFPFDTKQSAGAVNVMASPKIALGRMLVLLASAGAIVGAVTMLSLSWPAPPESFLARLTESTSIVTCMLVLGMAMLIAWRAGDHEANIAIALSLTFIFGSIVVGLLLGRIHVMPRIRQLLQLLLFFLGSAFYIRSTQLFPRRLEEADIASSPTIWSRSEPLKRLAIRLLHPAAAWVIAAAATAVIAASPSAHVFVPMWMGITLTGILYFYITFRGADAEARNKVLWFLEAALAAAILTMLAGALDLASGGSLTPDERALIQLVFGILNGVAMVVCFAAALFYAGAISPAFIVRKTLVYATTVAALLFLAAVVEIYVAHTLIHALHVSDRFGSAVLGAIFGLAFHPLKHRIEHFLKRFVPRDEATAAQAISSPGTERG
jgi:hypothetical protein